MRTGIEFDWDRAGVCWRRWCCSAGTPSVCRTERAVSAAVTSLVSRITLLMLACPAGMFLGHVLAYRGLSAAGRRPTAHTSAIASMALSFVAVVVIAAAWTWADLPA